MHAKSLTALLILSTAMAAPGIENKEGGVRGSGRYSNDYSTGPTMDADWDGSQASSLGPAKEGKPLGPAVPASALTAQGSPVKAPAGDAAPGADLSLDGPSSSLSLEGPSSALSLEGPSSSLNLEGPSGAAPGGASKDSKDSKDAASEKPAGKSGQKGAMSDERSGGKYEHSEGSWEFEYKDNDECDKCKGKGGDKPHKKPEPKPTSTSCATDVASATPPPPPPPKSKPSCPLASNGSTPCAAPKAPQTPVAKNPEGETKPPPPAQVGGGPASTPAPAPSKPEGPKAPEGAKPPPKSTPSKPVTFKNAAAGFAAAPLAQIAFFGVVSYAVAALIL